jgi:hypothetical protein
MPDTAQTTARSTQSHGDPHAAASPNGSQAGDVAELPDLVARLSAVTARFLEVVGQMGQTAVSMRESGAPPQYQLLNALGDCHRQFLTIRHEVVRKATSLGVRIRVKEHLKTLRDVEAFLETLSEAPAPAGSSTAPPPAAPATRAPEIVAPPVAEPLKANRESVADVVPAVAPPENAPSVPEPLAVTQPEVETRMPECPPAESVAAAEPACPEGVAAAVDASPSLEPAFAAGATGPDEVIQRALLALGKASRLTTRDGSELPAILEYQDEVSRLRYVVESGSVGEWQPMAESLASGKHPVAMLANAVEGKQELTDSEWADLHAAVTDTFGRPLAVALARHRLVVTPSK